MARGGRKENSVEVEARWINQGGGWRMCLPTSGLWLGKTSPFFRQAPAFYVLHSPPSSFFFYFFYVSLVPFSLTEFLNSTRVSLGSAPDPSHLPGTTLAFQRLPLNILTLHGI